MNNLIGKCRAYAYYAKPVPFRLSPGDRGGTSRDAKLINNMIYDCGVGAICFPTKDNKAEGNAYIRQARGGDLRIMYPAPEVCLDLKSWREFYGFDLTGAEGWFDIEVDTEKLTLQFAGSKDTPPGFGPVAPGRYVTDLSELKEVATDSRIRFDLTGNARHKDTTVPGPFATIETGKEYSIDPRLSEEKE